MVKLLGTVGGGSDQSYAMIMFTIQYKVDIDKHTIIGMELSICVDATQLEICYFHGI
jgi:hypothetical protein